MSDLFLGAGVVCLVIGMWWEGLVLIGLAWGAYRLLR